MICADVGGGAVVAVDVAVFDVSAFVQLASFI